MKQAILTLLLLGGAAMADAQETPDSLPPTPRSGSEETAGPAPPPCVMLPPVIVSAPPPTAASSELLIPGRDFELRPQGRPADILRLVPGLVISQHQGGGKAEQYFLRGFGYADLHFLIPERLSFRALPIPAAIDSRGRLRVDRRQEGRSGGGPAGPAVSSSSKCFSAQAHSGSRGTRRDSPRRVSEYSTARGAHLIPVLRMPVRNRSRSFSFR